MRELPRCHPAHGGVRGRPPVTAGMWHWKTGDPIVCFYSRLVKTESRNDMIDIDRLTKAYDEDRFYSLQLEVGDVCHQGCVYCYMNALEETHNALTADVIYDVIRGAQNAGITAVEWLGGEPLLRPEIFDFLQYAKVLGFRNNMWTGGLPLVDRVTARRVAELCMHGLISVHLTTLDPVLYERMHPGRTATDINDILSGVRHLLEAGYPPEQLLNSVTFTGLQPAKDLIATMDYFESELGVQTSVNVYHTYLRPGADPSELASFIPAPGEVAQVYRRWKQMLGVKHLPMNCVNKQYCSATVALLNTGYVTPCATIREVHEDRNVKRTDFRSILSTHRDDLCFMPFKDAVNLPADCRRCALNTYCWGCRSRAYAAGYGVYGKDPRCFRAVSR